MKAIDELNLEAGIRTVMKQIHPDLRVSKKYIDEVNFVIIKLLKELVKNALIITKSCGHTEVTGKSMMAATSVTLSEILGKFASNEGTKAVNRFNSYDDKDRSTRAYKAGLSISVSKVEAAIRSILPKRNRLSKVAVIYASGVLEYITAEVNELSGRAAQNDNKTTVTDKNFAKAFKDDKELAGLLPPC